MGEHKVGDAVKFVDQNGVEHNALVIHVWETCLNIVYVDPKSEADASGTERSMRTSIPFFQEGMSGNYVK